MLSRKNVRFNELIRHSDYEITYLGSEDDEMESLSCGNEVESKDCHRWSLTEGIPPSLPMRSKSPSVSGGRRVFPRDEYFDSMFLTSPLSESSSSSSSHTTINGSLDGELGKIASRDITRLPSLLLHHGENFSKFPLLTKKAEGSGRSMTRHDDLASTDHWSPLRSDDYNDYSPPTLPKRRGSGEGLTQSTFLDNVDDWSPSSGDCDDVPPPPFDK